MSYYIDYQGDPWDNDTISEYPHIQSAYYSGDYANITAPAAPNYPYDTPTRYFLNLPAAIDQTDLAGTRPIAIRDVTNSVTLTRVTGTPGANQYRIPPSTSKRLNVIELHSGQAGNEIGYDYYGTGGIINSKRMNELENINDDLTILAPISRGDTIRVYLGTTTGGFTVTKKASFDTLDYNTNANLFTHDTTNKRIAVSKNGIYKVIVQQTGTVVATNRGCTTVVRVNGADVDEVDVWASANNNLNRTMLWLIDMNANDYIEIFWDPFAGDTVAFSGFSSPYQRTWMSLTLERLT